MYMCGDARLVDIVREVRSSPNRLMAVRSLSVDQGLLAFNRKPSISDKVIFSHDDGSKSDAQVTNGIYNRGLPSLHFLRWRPIYHLLTPNAWMNNPCAPGFDPGTNTYHMSFQWNPRRNNSGNVAWGSIAWGHATSKDLMSWKVVGQPVLKPDQAYDCEGVFTGCMQPAFMGTAPSTLTVVYTSVSKLPIHYTLPYDRGCETLSIAQSSDGGKTWTKPTCNPILSGPPEDTTVSGWRDPFVAPWPSLDRLLGKEEGQGLYATLSGGISGQTPTLFLYSLDTDISGQWRYISPLVNLGLNHSISRWSGDMGINWEVANFFTLTDYEGGERNFIIISAEGCDPSHITEHDPEAGPPRSTQVPRTARSQQWMSGTLLVTRGAVQMDYRLGGRYDHGCLYGVTSIWDAQTSCHIAWGWITEEDLPQELVDRQNWSGVLSLPRELRLLTLHNVHSALTSKLKTISSLEITPDEHESYTIRTLGMRPASATKQLQKDSKELSIGATALPQINSGNVAGEIWLDVRSSRWEMTAEIVLSKTCIMVGLAIFHNQGKFPITFTFFCTNAKKTARAKHPSPFRRVQRR